MNTKALRQKILDLAIRGKLVPQNPNDEPASVLLDRIRAEKERLVKEGKIKRSKKNATSDTPHYEQDVPFEVPSGWCWCKLEDIAYVASGSTPSKDSFVEEGVPYLKMYNLRNQKIDFQFHPQFIKREVHEGKLARSIAKSGDLIMNIVGPPLGKLAIIPDELEECNFNQAAVMIRPYLFKNTINAYLFYYLSEMTEINSIATKGSAGQVNISLTQSQNMRIPLPPLAEQQRIIAEIEKRTDLFDVIEKDSVDLLELISQTKFKILDLAFRGKLVEQDENDEPASKLLKRINPSWQPSDTSHYEQLPNGWELTALKDIAEIVTGSTPSKSHKEYYGDYMLFIKPNDLDSAFVSKSKEFLSQEGAKVSRIVPKDSIAVCCIGSIGKTGYLQKECVTNQQINTIVPLIYPKYIYYFCLSNAFQEELLNKASAITISIVNKSKMEQISIPVPPLSEQKRIVAKIEELFAALDSISQALAD